MQRYAKLVHIYTTRNLTTSADIPRALIGIIKHPKNRPSTGISAAFQLYTSSAAFSRHLQDNSVNECSSRLVLMTLKYFPSG